MSSSFYLMKKRKICSITNVDVFHIKIKILFSFLRVNVIIVLLDFGSFFQSGIKFRYLEWKMWKSVCLSVFGLSFRAIHTFSFQLSTIFFLLKNLKFYFLFWRSPGDISNDILIPPGKVSFEPKTLLNIIFKSSMTSLIAVGF